MTKDDVLELFRKHAETLGNIKESQHDIIQSLARLMASSQESMSKDDFDVLVHIGAAMYQRQLGQSNARNETTDMMEKSVQERKDTTAAIAVQ